jgi:hypothetical protein
MPKSIPIRICQITLLATLASLSGCSWMNPFHWFGSRECVDNSSDYLHTEDHALLKIPAGADTPDRRNLFVVPEGTRNNAKGKCLDRPPSYFGYTGRIAASPEETVADWAQAWANRDSNAVISMYSAQFGSAGSTVSLDQRRTEIQTGTVPEGRIRGLKVSSVDNDRRLARFVQIFGSTEVTKEITLIREGGVWKIIDEKVITTK